MTEPAPGDIPQRDGLRRRVLRGIGGQAATHIALLVVQLAGVPLYLAWWGVDLYGEWLILIAIPAYLALGDLGFTSATAHAMTMESAAGKRDEALRSFRTTWWVVTGLSVAIAVAAMAALAFLPVDRWLGFTQLTGGDVGLVLLLLLGHIVLNLQTGLLNAGFQSQGEYGQGTALLAAAQLTEFGLIVLVVVSGHGPVEAAAAMVAGRAVFLVVMRYRLRRVAGWITFGLSGFSVATFRRLFGPALGFSGYIAGHLLNIQAPILIIGAALGPAAVVPFATLRTMIRLAQHLLASFSVIVRPEIGIAVGSGDFDLVRRLNRDASRLAVWLVMAFVIVLVAFGDQIVGLWTSGRVAAEQPLFGILILVMVVNTFWQVSAWVLQAVNRVQQQAAVYVLSNIVSVAVMAAFTAGAGIIVPALALLAAEIAMALHVVSRSLAFLDETPSRYFSALMRPPVDVLARIGRLGRRA